MDETRLRRATSFGSVADDYARARPGYPRAAVRWALEVAPGMEVLDLAAGTGKLTAAILDAGASVTAVEPLDSMRAQLEAAFPDVRALAGTAEAIPLADRSVDAVLVGQAFHWFDVGPALDEIVRVLRPGGVLAALWNLRDDTVPWIVAMTEAGAGGADMLSMADGGDWEPLEHDRRFTPPERRDFPNPEPFDTERLLALARSTSALATMGPDERDAVLSPAGTADPRAPRSAQPPDVHDAAGHHRHPRDAGLTPVGGRDLVTRISRSASSDARDRLLDAAERLLAAEGGAALTTRRIAGEAGVNHGLVHYHFGTVDDLVAALAERFAGRLVALQEALWTVDMTFADRFRAAAGHAKAEAKVWFELQALAWNRPALRARLAWHSGRWREVLTAAFADAAAGYGLGAASVEPLVTLVATFTQGMAAESLLGIDEGHDQLLRWVDAWLASLEPPPATSVGPG